ncbi:FkbM family methyltransferase [Dankookia rubra]|nr:FkbM family methyltransferase [Dankookia rubra]
MSLVDNHSAFVKFRARLVALLIAFADGVSRIVHHKGYWHACSVLSWAVPKDLVVSVQIANDAKFQFFLADAYWNSLLGKFFVYEDDVARLLLSLSHVEYTFIDCGANFGYWSVLLSSGSFGNKRVIAVEAASANFKLLLRNREANENRFDALHAAVTDSDGEMVSLSSSKHHSAVSVSQHLGGETICSTTLDAIVRTNLTGFDGPLVIKLDIEGLEAAAMRSASGVLGRALFIYEDHGDDPSCQTTAAVLNELRLTVYYIDAIGLMPIRCVEECRQIKKKRTLGYNFLAISPTASLHREIDRFVLDRPSGGPNRHHGVEKIGKIPA